MKKYFPIAILLVALACSSPSQRHNLSSPHASAVTIIRDEWGIPHVYGKSDADAVFGVMYAQAEDDFNRIETNLLLWLGRSAEAEGESEIYRDLRMKMFVSPEDLQAKYNLSPVWLQELMNAWADGLNFYLAAHPSVKPRVILHFEPWMALAYTDGSIGGDIERIKLAPLESFYGDTPQVSIDQPSWMDLTGSNGIAIAPARSRSGHALLLINPHTSFYFRAEAQMSSEAGLNAYGAMTWGQFFVYQGFNERCGWMHTSSTANNISEYAETIIERNGSLFYEYGGAERPVTVRQITIPYKKNGRMEQKIVTAYFTHHGPIVRAEGGKWISVRLMQDRLNALIQSFSRTKARSYAEFRQTMELHANSSNNTVYADGDGTIAYFHSNFIPARDPRFDWTRPVDGSLTATEWGAPLSIDRTPGLRNPSTGWLFNSNNWPWSAAGKASPHKADFPAYIDKGHETARGMHTLLLLEHSSTFTPESLLALAYDRHLPYFQLTLPRLFRAFEESPPGNLINKKVAAALSALRHWDFNWSADSVPTTLAIAWGDEVDRAQKASGIKGDEFFVKASPALLREAFGAAVERLERNFGSWKIEWGTINRYQRRTAEVQLKFDDSAESTAVPFVSGRWGSLAAFDTVSENTKKRYGVSGNSFVSIVEFGPHIRARAVTVGGESGDPKSRHFADQVAAYTNGKLREVYFYRSDLEGHTERVYHPGESN